MSDDKNEKPKTKGMCIERIAQATEKMYKKDPDAFKKLKLEDIADSCAKFCKYKNHEEMFAAHLISMDDIKEVVKSQINLNSDASMTVEELLNDKSGASKKRKAAADDDGNAKKQKTKGEKKKPDFEKEIKIDNEYRVVVKKSRGQEQIIFKQFKKDESGEWLPRAKFGLPVKLLEPLKKKMEQIENACVEMATATK